MLKKMILSVVVFIGLSTTGAMAKSNTHILTLAKKQESLSQSIVTAYTKHDSSSALASLRIFISRHNKLKAQINNPEMSNLLVYLSLCLKDLEEIVKKPYASKNVQKVADLSDSLSEGNHYIIASL